MPTLTEPKVYIIESLEFDDENGSRLEGHGISDILCQLGVENKYFYVRTREELEYFLDDFSRSRYRYLHISCHGSKDAVKLTLGDQIPLSDFASLLADKLDTRRLFLSACQATNDNLARRIFSICECHSIIGFNKKVDMDDAAVFWGSFYHILFRKDQNNMGIKALTAVLTLSRKLFRVPLIYYAAKPQNIVKKWQKVSLSPKRV